MTLDTSFQTIASQAFAVVEPQAEGRFLATFLGWPELQVWGDSRQEALEQLSQLVQERLNHAEIVPLTLEMPTVTATHPWAQFAGMFAEDKQFGAVMEEVEACRQELDKNDSAKSNEDGEV